MASLVEYGSEKVKTCLKISLCFLSISKLVIVVKYLKMNTVFVASVLCTYDNIKPMHFFSNCYDFYGICIYSKT